MEIAEMKRLRQDPVDLNGIVLRNESRLCPAGNPEGYILIGSKATTKIQTGKGEPGNLDG